MRGVWSPMRIGAFRRLIGAYAVNAVGNWMGQIALSVLVLERTHSPATVASVMIVGQFLPSLVAPSIVARLELLTSPVLPALLIGEALVFAWLTVMAPTGSLALVLLAIGVDGLLGLAARALLKASIVGVTAPAGLLREGNSVLMCVFTVCMATGPVAAGIIIGLASAPVALALDALSFLLAAGALLRLAPAHRREVTPDEPSGRMREAITYVRRHPSLTRLLSACTLLNFASAAILPLEVVLVTRSLGAGPAAFGTVLALWGAGAALGSALLPRLRHRPLIPLSAASFVVMAVAYMGMGLAPGLGIVCAFSFLGGIGNGVEGFATMTAVQEQTRFDMQARVAGLMESLTSAACGLGFVAGGGIAAVASVRAVYVGSALAILLVTPVMLRGVRRATSAPVLAATAL
jgi:hypothetical protein